jgi:hypothetical protein
MRQSTMITGYFYFWDIQTSRNSSEGFRRPVTVGAGFQPALLDWDCRYMDSPSAEEPE